MKRMLYRMALRHKHEGGRLTCPVEIRQYKALKHHEAIRTAYGRSFAEVPWPSDWDRFDEFDGNGVFVAEVIGFILSFRRSNYGYISVVAVVPEYRRKGVGLALVRTAISYLHGLGLRTIKVDAFVDAIPAVNLYQKVGFSVEKTFEDTDGSQELY